MAARTDRRTYVPPSLAQMGSFSARTLGSSGSIAFDFYITDKPHVHSPPLDRIVKVPGPNPKPIDSTTGKVR